MSKIIDIEVSDLDFDLLATFQKYNRGDAREIAGHFLSVALSDFRKAIREVEKLNPER